MDILVGLSPKTTTMRHVEGTMRPLEDTATITLLKGPAFSSNCLATNVMDFEVLHSLPRRLIALIAGLHSAGSRIALRSLPPSQRHSSHHSQVISYGLQQAQLRR